MQRVLGVSERRACQVLGQARSTHRYESVKPEGDRALVAAMDELRQRYTRIGCRGVWIRLRRAGWSVNRKRVHRIWKAEGWQIRSRRRKRRGRGLSANSCAVRRAEHRGHVWSYDFVLDRTEQGGLLKFLAVLDEHTREAHAIEVGRSFTGKDVVEVLQRLFRLHGKPEYLRSDNGTEFMAEVVQKGLEEAGVSPLFIAPGSPWENGYSEAFNSRFRDEFLDRELFANVREAAVLAEQFRVEYNEERPHMSLGYLTPAEFARNSAGAFFRPRDAGTSLDSLRVGEGVLSLS